MDDKLFSLKTILNVFFGKCNLLPMKEKLSPKFSSV